MQQYIDKAAVLVEALPYIQSFRDRIVVVKYGGSTMGSRAGERGDTVLRDIVFMEHVGMNPVIVHGGGKAIDDRLRKAGVETRRINGLRVTDEATMRVVEETLCGEVNAGIVGEIEALGGKAVGVSAKDAGVMSVSKHFAETDGGKVDIGFVGDVDHIEPKPLFDHIEQGQIPVVAPIGRGENGESYNVNADTAAGEIAAALHAEKLVFLTDVRGVMTDPRDADSLLSTVHVDEVSDLIACDIIKGGMIPKVKACVHSVKAGVRKTHVIDGTIPHSMLLEVFTDAGVGTQIVQ
ncbi:MAG TPA: acetylglutamate kinase [Candidatus Latescibacteria bacterium]|nr:acetylglutamate kinase [Candidatus Latescibacterota bacterium]HIM55677.1 acetylglutamate kinase [Candidatus Latescibacterota bacterium]